MSYKQRTTNKAERDRAYPVSYLLAPLDPDFFANVKLWEQSNEWSLDLDDDVLAALWDWIQRTDMSVDTDTTLSTNSLVAVEQTLQPEANDSNEVWIPTFNCGSELLFQFLKSLFDKCKTNCPEILVHVDWSLVEKYKDDIYFQIWSLQSSKECPQYMKEDSGRLIRLSFIFVRNYEGRINNTIALTLKEYDTIIFIMACIRKQSTKGRKMTNPQEDKINKEKKKRRLTRLIPEDIKERMEKELPGNIEKYYYVVLPTEENQREYVEIFDKQWQPFRPLFENNVRFHAFMKEKKPTNSKMPVLLPYTNNNNNNNQPHHDVTRVTPQKRPRDEPGDTYEDSNNEQGVQHGPRKSLRVAHDTTPAMGMALAPSSQLVQSEENNTNQRTDPVIVAEPVQQHTAHTEAVPVAPERMQAVPQDAVEQVVEVAMDLFPDLSDYLAAMQDVNASIDANSVAPQLVNEEDSSADDNNDSQSADFSVELPELPSQLDLNDTEEPGNVNTEAKCHHQHSVGAK